MPSDWLDDILFAKRGTQASILLTSQKVPMHGRGTKIGHPLHRSDLFLGAGKERKKRKRRGKRKGKKRGGKRGDVSRANLRCNKMVT